MWVVLICVYLPLVSSQCYWNNRNPYPYFGTKTPYDTVRGDFRDVPEIEGQLITYEKSNCTIGSESYSTEKSRQETQQLLCLQQKPYFTFSATHLIFKRFPDCEPISIWFMIRHGTRRPSSADTRAMRKTSALKDDIVKNHAEGKGEMCAQDIDDLQNWTWNPKLDYKISYLTSHGYQELFEFGQRFGQKFSSFLEDVSSSVIRPTSEQRTQGSVKAFVQGLQGVSRTFDIEDHILNDPVARPYRYCAKRGAKIINSTRLSFEIKRFQETQEFRQVQENVQRKTGIKKELKPSAIMRMYDLCRFYRSYSLLKRSPWCSVFSDDDLEILEYFEDVRHYYRNGYGKTLNALTGAASLKDLYEKFQNVTKSGNKSFTAYFTHDTMVDMIYTAMGLYEDYPKLTGFERIKDRKWRTSFLTPFAANFVAVLRRCPKNVASTTYRIQFLVNEKELHLCGDRVCSWSDFRSAFEGFTNATLDFCEDLTYVYNV